MSLKFGNKKVVFIIIILLIAAFAGFYFMYLSLNTSKINLPGGNTNVNTTQNQNGTTTTDSTNPVNNPDNPYSPYIKDKEAGSYIWFSGNKWILLDKTESEILLISADPIAINCYNTISNNSYDLSYIRSWLNEKYYNTLNNKDYIKSATYTWKSSEDGTKSQVTDKVGMLTKEDYIKYSKLLPVGKYYWTMSASTYGNSQTYFVSNTGKLDIGTVDSKYGIKPVIRLINTVSIKSGKGTKDSPYKLEQEYIARAGDRLNSRHSGEYISYSDMTWRVVEVNADGTTKLACNVAFWYEGFDKRNIPVFNLEDKNNMGYFLNSVVLNNLSNNSWIVPKVWSLKDFGYVKPGIPDENDPAYNQYEDYKNRLEEIERNKDDPEYEMPELTNDQIYYERNFIESVFAKVGLLQIGDLMTTTDINADWWLITQPKDTPNKLYYIYSLTGIISKADAFTNFPARPVINLDAAVYITGGDGSIDSPYTLAK